MSVLEPSLVELPEGKFLSWPNIGDPRKMIPSKQSTKLALAVDVVPRKTYVFRGSDIELAEMHPDLITECLDHLYARMIFNIGDSAFYNILIADYHREEASGLATGHAVGVDMEEHRYRMLFDTVESMLFSRKPRNCAYLQKFYSKISQAPPGWEGTEGEMIKIHKFQSLIEKMYQ